MSSSLNLKPGPTFTVHDVTVGIRASELLDQGKSKPEAIFIMMKEGESTATILKDVVGATLLKVAADISTFGLMKYKVNEERAKYMWQKYVEKTNKPITFEAYLEIKQGQTRAAIGEARIMLTLALMMMMLGADWDDDHRGVCQGKR